MGQGYALSGAAAGAADALQEVLTRARLEQLDRQRKDEWERTFRASQEQWKAQQENAKQDRAHRLASMLPPGAELDEAAASVLRAANLSPLIRREAATLPSTALSGQVDATAAAPALRGQLLRVSQEGRPERDVYSGTPAQLVAAENARSLSEQREATAADRRAEAEARAARTRAVQGLMENPNLPPATRQWLQGAAAGFNQLTPHDYEPEDVHGRHVSAERQAKIDAAVAQHRGIRDYDIANPLPSRAAGGGGEDNPQIPHGAQLYAVEIARKHGNDYNAALQEAQQYLGSAETRRAHPNLSPQRFIGAMQAAMRRPGGARGGSSGEPQAALSVFSGDGGGGTPAAASASSPSAAVRIRGARVLNPQAPRGNGGTVKMRAPNGDISPVPLDQVEHFKKLGASVVK